MTRTRLIVLSTGLVVAIGVSIYAFHVTEQFLIRDSRFAVAAADASTPRGVSISGVKHASARAIDAVFAEDIGRSLYMVPLADRQASLREVSWVRDASVARVWPNRLVVKVEERVPVAFLMSHSRAALIDADGVVLPPSKGDFKLPVLAGVKEADLLEQRHAAVTRMLEVVKDLGDAVSDLSEIDVSEPENVSVTREYQGHLRRLLLGDEDFGRRYQSFLKHFAKIESQAPGARVIDMRLEDRITVVKSE